MKKTFKRVLASALAAAMIMIPAVSASEAMGSEVHTVKQSLGEGVELTRQHLWSATYSDLRTEHYLTYTPAEGIRPALVYGDKVVSKQNLTAMAQRLEKDGKRVLGGINGDYYVVATGAPLGLVITEGELRSTPQYDTSWALGFREDGTAFVGQPGLSVSATFGGQTLAITGGINKVREEQGGYYLLTEDFGTSTMNTSPGIDVILRPVKEEPGSKVTVERPAPAAESESIGQSVVDASEELTAKDVASDGVTKEDVLVGETPAQTVQVTLERSDMLKINSRVSCEVVNVFHSEGKIEIPAGCFVLTINKNGNAWLQEQLAALTPGQRMEIDVISLDSRWEQAVTAVGGMYKLVTEGAVEEGLSTEQHPRSAVGVRADGSTVFYTVDGRQSGYSVGAGMDQVAKRLVELGCVEAVCLDGGGSTTMGVTWPDGTALDVVNKPSDGRQRNNTNALFLVSERVPTGELDHFYITPNDNLLMVDSWVQLTANAVDTAGFPMEWSGELTWSVQEGEGAVTREGLFIAGKDSGLVTVAVTDGEKTGTVCIQVVRTPHTLRVSNEATDATITSLHLEPGESMALTAESKWWNLPLSGTDEHYVWTADPAVGSVDETGLFTAAPANGKGHLIVSTGEKSAIIPVTISGHILPLEDFEGDDVYFINTDTAFVEQNTNLERVRFGWKSGQVTYRPMDGLAIFGTNLPIKAGEKLLSLWVWGDGSGNELVATLADGAGVGTEIKLADLDFTGWKQVKGGIPEGSVLLRSIALRCAEGQTGGTIWLDQLTTSNGEEADNVAPTIEITAENGILQAVISDNFDSSVAAERISVSLDGQKLDFSWEEAAAKLTLALPQDNAQKHRLTITASDISGNLARASYEFSNAEEKLYPFLDMEEHWAQDFANYLHQLGVTNGIAVEGGFEFQPSKAISRGEFALMMARWMGLDLDSYGEVELPFADGDTIPEWMLPAVRAMYAEGIMKGSQRGDALYANATQPISRAESMTLLGRIQSRGYPAGELTFADAWQVPDWSLEHVKSLVAQGVVNGYNNLITPNNLVTRGEVAKMLVVMM